MTFPPLEYEIEWSECQPVWIKFSSLLKNYKKSTSMGLWSTEGYTYLSGDQFLLAIIAVYNFWIAEASSDIWYVRNWELTTGTEMWEYSKNDVCNWKTFETTFQSNIVSAFVALVCWGLSASEAA